MHLQILVLEVFNVKVDVFPYNVALWMELRFLIRIGRSSRQIHLLVLSGVVEAGENSLEHVTHFSQLYN